MSFFLVAKFSLTVQSVLKIATTVYEREICFGVSAFQFSLSAFSIANLAFGISDVALSSWHLPAFSCFSAVGILLFVFSFRHFEFIFIGPFSIRHLEFRFQLSPFPIWNLVFGILDLAKFSQVSVIMN